MGKKRKNNFDSLDDVLENGSFTQILVWHSYHIPTEQSKLISQRQSIVNSLYTRSVLMSQDLESLLNILSYDLVNLREFSFAPVNTSYEKLSALLTDKNLLNLLDKSEQRIAQTYDKFEKRLMSAVNYYKNYGDMPLRKRKRKRKIKKNDVGLFLESLKNRSVNLRVASLIDLKSYEDLKHMPLFIITKDMKKPDRFARKLAEKMITAERSINYYNKYVIEKNNVDNYIWHFRKDILENNTLKDARKIVLDTPINDNFIYSVEINDLAGITFLSMEPFSEDKNNFIYRTINSIYNKNSEISSDNKKGPVKIKGPAKNFFKNPKHDKYNLFSYKDNFHIIIRPRGNPHRNLRGQINYFELQIHPVFSYLEYELGSNNKLSHSVYETRQNQFEKTLTRSEKVRYNWLKNEALTILKMLD